MKICEIYPSIQGESEWTGQPCIFVRTHGCNLRCGYCDTVYATKEEEYKEMTIEQVLEAVDRQHIDTKINLVEITGGEPLIAEGIVKLVEGLHNQEYEILIETNGSQPLPPEFFDMENLYIIMDVKCPCSEMERSFLVKNLEVLRITDNLKFVVKDEKDFTYVESFLKHYKKYHKILETIPIYMSPVHGADLQAIAEFIMKLHKELGGEMDIRYGYQLHKIIWPPDQRGV